MSKLLRARRARFAVQAPRRQHHVTLSKTQRSWKRVLQAKVLHAQPLQMQALKAKLWKAEVCVSIATRQC